MIYKRFTEKSAEEWRQIYKALQLMEFLVKNGSERVIDDARSHLSLLKMLRQFHYIDQNGKDQGINVRNRSKELTDLLSDVDRIRQERKKARATKNKYTGVEGGAGFGPGSSGGRYGGFGSESAGYGGSSSTFGGTTRGVYGDGGGFGGESHDDYDESGRRGGADRFDEYDEYDDGGAQAPPPRRKTERPSRSASKKAEPPKPKEPEQDLFDFGDDEPAMTSAPISAPSNGTSSAAILSPPTTSTATADDDDFDDFQSATPSTTAAQAPMAAPSIPKPNYSSISTATPTPATQFAQPTPQQGANNQAAFSNIFSTSSRPSSTAQTPSSAFSPPPQQKQTGSGYQPTGPNYFTSVQVQPQQSGTSTPGGSVTSPMSSAPSNTPAAAKKPAAGGDAFASLLGGSGMKRTGTPTQKGQTMADMAKAKSQAGLYGANAPSMPAQQQPSFGGSSGQKSGTGSQGMDDLLG